MLALLLLLAAIYLLKHGGRGKAAAVAAGVLVALAFLTKQLALAAALPLLLYLLFTRRRDALLVIGAVVLLGGGATWLLDRASGGWYLYHVFKLPSLIRATPNVAGNFWVWDVLGTLAFACALAMLYVMTAWRTAARQDSLFYVATAAGLLGASWAARLPGGGYNNVLLPGYAAIAVLFGLSVHAILDWLKSAPEKLRGLLESYVYAVCILQYAWLAYNPVTLVPPALSVDAGGRFIQRLRREPGDVLVAYHGYYATLGGKKMHAHWVAVSDVLKWDERGAGRSLKEEIVQAAERHRYNAIILDASQEMSDDIRKHYRWAAQVFDSPEEFWPVTGMRTRPEYVYEPRPAPQP
jgi:hypothetical protein